MTEIANLLNPRRYVVHVFGGLTSVNTVTWYGTVAPSYCEP
jgi:hypothetical protein